MARGEEFLVGIVFLVIALYLVATIVPNAVNQLTSASVSSTTIAPLVTTLTPIIAVFAIVLGFVYLMTHSREGAVA